MKRVEGYGPGSSNLMIIGIAPGHEETIQGRPFVGPSGSLLKEDLKDAGISLDSCYRTNIFKFQLPNNEFRLYQEMGLSLPDALNELRSEIDTINPNCILGLGDPVLSSLAGKSGKKNGINEWRGSILKILNDRKAVFTYHPAAELHGSGEGTFKSWQKYIRKFDIKRAVDESNFKEFDLPSRYLHIARDSADVYRFIERALEAEYCAVDIESIEHVPICIGLSFKTDEAISIPLWNLLNISATYPKAKKNYKYDLEVSTIPDSDLASIWSLLAKFFLNRKIKFIGQNFKYDEDKLNRLGFYFHSLFGDTLISQQLISSELPKSLGFQTSIYTREPYYKDEGRDYIPGKDRIRDLLLYNCKDAACTLEIFLAHLQEFESIPFAEESFINFRSKLHKVYHNIEKVGFKTDDVKRGQLIKKYIERLVHLEIEFRAITLNYTEDIINIASDTRIAKLIYEEMGIRRREGTGEEVLTALLANVVKKPEQRRALEIILEHRKVDKTIGTYLAAENDYDGRMKTTYFITGTESYRTSTQILKSPIRNSWKDGNKSKGKKGWALQTVTKHGDTGQDLRSILVADKGYVFINVDQSTAEPRVCSLLADDEETLAYYSHGDIHGLTAAKVFGGEEKDYSKKIIGYEKPERFMGKTSRNAYHLGIKKHALMLNINTDARKYKIPVNISEWKAGEILKVLQQMTPRIQTVFHEGIKEALYKSRRLHGTYGASFYFYDEFGDELWKAAYSRIPQQTVTDKTKSVAIWAQKNIWDCKVVGESHDALLFLCPERKVDDYIPLIREQFELPIDFSTCSLPRRELIIPCDVEYGYNYEELNKYQKGLKYAS